ncbi:MAG: HXXEE domain-containing protein [Bacteroidetes bacterium]|nr:MAG: HXXEE domain-containing protein [Bacteroidota bacterium]
MKHIRMSTLVWLLPLFYLAHLLEEYLAGEGFPVWFSRVLGADLSEADFILINSIGISIFILAAIFYTRTRKNTIMVTTLATVLFLNGWVHLFSSFLSRSYSPGTITGLVLYLPLGYLLFCKLQPPLTRGQRSKGVLLAILAHLAIAAIALTI